MGMALPFSLTCTSGGKYKYQDGLSPWPLCLNTSTIRPASLDEKIRIASDVGYDAIELWMNELEEYESAGGNLKELGLKIRDKGLFVTNVIGLWNCLPADENDWQKSLGATRNRMRLASEIGSKHVAAIPTPDRDHFDLIIGAQRYSELLKIGLEEFGVIAAFEFVGFFKGIHRLGQAAAIGLEANHKNACLIMDTFHLYRGDSAFNAVQHLNGEFIALFHFNDVPATVPREKQGDEHRIYPGDGILPLQQLLKDLIKINYRGALSLELFNRQHWEQDLEQVAQTGFMKLKELIRSTIHQED